MIGKTQIYKRSMVPYFYIGGDGDGQLPGFQPPTGGCFLRLDAGEGGFGSVTITGTYGGEDVEETVTSFDSDGIAISTERFATITSFDVTLVDSTSITIYPADEMGNTINYNTYSTSYVRGDWSYSSSTTNNKLTFNIGGEQVESEIEFLYNTNYNLNRDDLLGIDGYWYKVELTQKISRSTRKAYLTNTHEIFGTVDLSEGIELNQAQVQALIDAKLAEYDADSDSVVDEAEGVRSVKDFPDDAGVGDIVEKSGKVYVKVET